MKVRFAIIKMSTTSIMSSKCLHTSHGIYIRRLYHSGMSLVLILHERVHLPTQKAKNLALKSLHGGTFGYKHRWAPLRLCLSSVCTHHMGYIKDVCIIQIVPWYWYSTNKSIYHPRKPKILLWNLQNEGTFGSEKDVVPLNYGSQVFVHITWYIYKMFVSFRNVLGTDTSRTSPFTNQESKNLALKPLHGGTFGYK